VVHRVAGSALGVTGLCDASGDRSVRLLSAIFGLAAGTAEVVCDALVVGQKHPRMTPRIVDFTLPRPTHGTGPASDHVPGAGNE
jgi:hypothetical protein